MDKIKVLEIIDGGFLGGGQTNILSIIKGLDKEKYDVAVAAEGGGKFEKAVKESCIKFYPIKMPKVLRQRHFRHLEHLYDIKRFDIVHSHGGVAGFYGRLLKKHHRELKSVHTIHGIHYINNRFWIKNISKTIEQYLVQFTDMTICVSLTDMKVAFENRIADSAKTVVIQNGINIPDYKYEGKNQKLMNELGLNENNFIIGNISRFDIQKNQKLLIQAAYYLSRNCPEMKFVLVGDGKCFKEMKEYAMEANLKDVVIFTGEREDKKDFYSIFDIFILPSLWEGLPYVLLEAMASRLPVICSNIPNHLEIVKNNYSAFLVNPFEMDELFQRVSVLYHNKDIRDKLAANAYEAVLQYDEKDMVRKIEKIYEEVL
ncbi:MAG: glycosyltransferase family 1 protein [Ignavibacteriae bacterium]|nr:MAG: glycosyltransferase family 1 protein [Ignavibacteriota bacterium]